MKKIIAIITMFLSIPILSAETLSNASAVDSRNRRVTVTVPQENIQSPLVNATSAAFNIYLTSANTSGAVTGRYSGYSSSITIEELCSTGGSATYYFNILLSTSDTLADLRNRINDITNWTCTLAEGCYGLQYATGSASTRVDGEGTTDGLQYDATGKSVSFSTGSANTVTIYLNGTLYLSKYFEPISNKKYWVHDIHTSLLQGTTIFCYEGVTSTITTTLLAIPQTQVKRIEYSPVAPVKGTTNRALEIEVQFGTWTVNTGTLRDRLQPFVSYE